MPEGGPKGGTLRTWPLGLANARSLGDAPNAHVIALPEVLRVRGRACRHFAKQHCAACITERDFATAVCADVPSLGGCSA